jgi:hypothetical protein
MSRTLILGITAATIAFLLPCVRAHAPAPRGIELPVGKWSIEFANEVKEECEVNKDGDASVVEPLRSSTGKAEVKEDSVVIVFKDDRVERWTPVGAKMVVEHWAASVQFPAGRPVLGIGRKE